MIPSTRLALVALLAAPTCLASWACGGGPGSAVGDARLPAGAASKNLDHEQCNESGNRVEALDLNGDGKPDIRRIFDKRSGREICRVADLNRDGKPDMYEYYDASGQVRRREYCYDDTGIVNAIEYYEGGKLARREYDTMGQRRIDTWDWFDGQAPIDPKTGRPTHPSRRERDVDGIGRVSQWWTWDGDKVTIVRDTNNDGKADPASMIVLGGDKGDKGAAPASSGGSGGGPDGQGAPAADGGASPAASASAAATPATSSSATPATSSTTPATSSTTGDAGKAGKR